MNPQGVLQSYTVQCYPSSSQAFRGPFTVSCPDFPHGLVVNPANDHPYAACAVDLVNDENCIVQKGNIVANEDSAREEGDNDAAGSEDVTHNTAFAVQDHYAAEAHQDYVVEPDGSAVRGQAPLVRDQGVAPDEHAGRETGTMPSRVTGFRNDSRPSWGSSTTLSSSAQREEVDSVVPGGDRSTQGSQSLQVVGHPSWGRSTSVSSPAQGEEEEDYVMLTANHSTPWSQQSPCTSAPKSREFVGAAESTKEYAEGSGCLGTNTPDKRLLVLPAKRTNPFSNSHTFPATESVLQEEVGGPSKEDSPGMEESSSTLSPMKKRRRRSYDARDL